jgi:hypothetical protein
MPKRPSGPLRCHRCGKRNTITASGAQQRLRVDLRLRDVAHLRCVKCHNEWWSVHPVALEMGREADAVARSGGKGG